MTDITYDEAVETALLFLRAIVRSQQDGFSPKAAHEGGALKENMLQIMGFRRISEKPNEIISEARRLPEMFDALRFGAAMHLAVGNDLPAQVNKWVADFLLGKHERPTAIAGAPSKIGFQLYLKFLVDMLVEKGMTATRNEASEPCSACDAVADALKKEDLKPSSYEGVKGIYLKLNKWQDADGGIRVTLDGKPS